MSRAVPKSFPDVRELDTDELAEDEVLMRTDGTIVDLPPADTKRWVVRRKAAVVAAVRSGAIGLQKRATAIDFRTKNSLPGSEGSRITASPVYGPPACKSTMTPLGLDRQSRSTEH